jgi:hypothetical protein
MDYHRSSNSPLSRRPTQIIQQSIDLTNTPNFTFYDYTSSKSNSSTDSLDSLVSNLELDDSWKNFYLPHPNTYVERIRFELQSEFKLKIKKKNRRFCPIFKTCSNLYINVPNIGIIPR